MARMSSTKPTYGTSGGKIHPAFPTTGRYGTETVQERADRRLNRPKSEAEDASENEAAQQQ